MCNTHCYGFAVQEACTSADLALDALALEDARAVLDAQILIVSGADTTYMQPPEPLIVCNEPGACTAQNGAAGAVRHATLPGLASLLGGLLIVSLLN